MNALLPFYAIYVGDGSSTVFTLDVSKDPFYFQNDLTGFGAANAFPGNANLSPEFDHKLSPSAVIDAQAHNAVNNNDYGPVSISIDQYQITFTLTTAPASGTKFAVQGFIEY